MGTLLFPFLFNRSIQYSGCFLFLVFFFVCLFVCFVAFLYIFIFFSFTGSRNGGRSCGRALEHLKSSGTNCFMNGPVVCKLCVGRNRDRNKQISLKMNFNVFQTSQRFFHWLFTTLAKNSWHAGSLP